MTAALVQSACNIGNSLSFTLGVAPTNGNLLIALTTNFTVAVTANSGWTKIYEGSTSIADDVLRVWTKTAGAGESATQVPFTDSNPRGGCGTLFEVSGAGAAPIIVGSDEHAASVLTLTSGTATFDSLFLAIVSTTGSNELPTITGPSAIAGTSTGVSTAASPRGITAVSENVSTGGTGSTTATFAVSRNVYGLSALIAGIPGPSTLWVGDVARETLGSGLANLRVADVARETLGAGTSALKVGAIAREILRSGTSGSTQLQTAALVREVLVSSTVAALRRRQLINPI